MDIFMAHFTVFLKKLVGDAIIISLVVLSGALMVSTSLTDFLTPYGLETLLVSPLDIATYSFVVVVLFLTKDGFVYDENPFFTAVNFTRTFTGIAMFFSAYAVNASSFGFALTGIIFMIAAITSWHGHAR